MINKDLQNLGFQTFFVSKEESNCPLITDVVRFSKKYKELDFLQYITTVVISLGYGKRVLINGSKTNFGNINREDFLEIVDYDPVKKILLVLGNKEPNVDTPVHWIIHHARDDVNAIIQLNDEKLFKNLEKKLVMTEKKRQPGSLELAKEILRTLRKSNRILIKNRGVLFVGGNLKEAEALFLKTYEESK